MTAAHDSYLKRVLKHVDGQIRRTKKAIAEQDVAVEVALIGGVTGSPYLVQAIRDHVQRHENIHVVAIEDHRTPLVAIGCILCLGQAEIGKRYASKEAYGIPVAVPFDRSVHRTANRWVDERTD